MKSNLILSCSMVCCLAIVPAARAQTLNFDFGANTAQTADIGWNNVVYTNGSPSAGVPVVVDSTGVVVPGVSLDVTDQFYIVGQPSQGGSETPSGDAAGFPVSATDDYFFGHTGPFGGGGDNPTGGFTLTGLTAGQAYDFTFFSSRTGLSDNRQTAFSVTGSNFSSGVVASSNNDTQVLRINGITPDGGNQIGVEVSAGPLNDNGNGFYYLNLVQVTVPEPGTVACLSLLALSGLMAIRRRSRHPH